MPPKAGSATAFVFASKGAVALRGFAELLETALVDGFLVGILARDHALVE
jgi:hypothetical protein